MGIILREPSRGRMKLSTELLVFGLFAITISTAFPASKNMADNLKVLDLVNSREQHLTLWEKVPIEEVEDDGYSYPTPSNPKATTIVEIGYPSSTATPSYPKEEEAAATPEGNSYPSPKVTPSYTEEEEEVATTPDGDGYPSPKVT